MKFSKILVEIKKAFSLKGKPVSAEPHPKEPATTCVETPVEDVSSNDDLHVINHNSLPEFDELHKQEVIVSQNNADSSDSLLADVTLVNQIRSRGINLGKISVDAIGFGLAIIGGLRRRNILTVEQLCNCTITDLRKLPFDGIIDRRIRISRIKRIQAALNDFLNQLLANPEEKRARQQLSFGPIIQKVSIVQEDPKQQMIELAERLCSIFKSQIPLDSALFPPLVWNNLVEFIGKEPESFDDLKRSAQVLQESQGYGIDSDNPEKYRALKSSIQWLKRATEYDCLDDELNDLIDGLDERERLILRSRYKIELPLTLEALGRQLGITRERVRQIQQKVQKKIVPRVRQSTLLFSSAALCILKNQKGESILATWTRLLVDFGLVRNPQSVELLVAVARATNSNKLPLPEEFIQSLELHVSQPVLAATKPVLEKARKMCRNCGVIRALSLVNDKTMKEDVEQILRLNGYKEVDPGWWTRDSGECVLERVAVKVIMYCGSVSPSNMRYASTRHLSRFQLPAPPSELLTKLLCQKDTFLFDNGLIKLTKPPTIKPTLTGPEQIFLNMSQSDGPILSFEAIRHKLLESGFSPGSVTALLRYSPIIQKIATALYSLLGAKYDELDIQEAQSQQTRISANSTLRARSDGVIEFEINAGTWLEYGGVLASGPAASLKGDWKLIDNGSEPDQLIVDGSFIRGLSKVSKSLGVVPGDRIRIDFNTWTREAKMIKVVENE